MERQSNTPGKNPSVYFLVWGIVAAGILIRLFHLFDNRSLWEDEVYLSTGLIKFDYKALLDNALPYQQKAPIGYLWAARACLKAFGTSEIYLRLFPFVCSVLSLPFFVKVTRYFFKPAGQVAAVALMAFGPIIIYHGVEAKQYAVEMFSVVLLLYAYIKFHTKTKAEELLHWGVLGGIVVWFSFASIFVLAAMALTIVIDCLVTKKYKLLATSFIVFVLWFGSFIVNYALFTHKDSDTGWLVFFFVKHDAFMPLSAKTIPWIVERMVSFLNYPMGLSWVNIYNAPSALHQAVMRMIFIPIILSFAGAYQLYQKNRALLLIIVSSFIIVFAASALKLYPFHERLTLFLVPLFIMILAAGFDFFSLRLLRHPLIQATLVVLLLYGPVKSIAEQTIDTNLFGDYKKSYQREALLYLDEQYKPGDEVYVYWNDLPGYRLYKKLYNLQFNAVEGIDYRHKANNFTQYFDKVKADLAAFKGKKRVWIVQQNRIDIPVGDYIGDPAWYYQHNDGTKRFTIEVNKLATPVQQFMPDDAHYESDVRVTWMDFSKSR